MSAWRSSSATNASASLTVLCRSEEHTSELQSRQYLVCRLRLEKKKEAAHERDAGAAREPAGRGQGAGQSRANGRVRPAVERGAGAAGGAGGPAGRHGGADEVAG